MRKYLSEYDAVIDMHERGFYDDFKLVGTDLFWVQEKTFVRAGNYVIIERYSFVDQYKGSGVIVFGIFACCHGAKGILMKHINKKIVKMPPIVSKKMEELMQQ